MNATSQDMSRVLYQDIKRIDETFKHRMNFLDEYDLNNIIRKCIIKNNNIENVLYIFIEGMNYGFSTDMINQIAGCSFETDKLVEYCKNKIGYVVDNYMYFKVSGWQNVFQLLCSLNRFTRATLLYDFIQEIVTFTNNYLPLS